MKLSISLPTTIAYDPDVYSSFPDITKINDDYLVVYREGNSHHPDKSKLIFLKSKDLITWAREEFATASLESDGFVFNCPKFSTIGKTTYLSCDTKTSTKEKDSIWNIFYWTTFDGNNWASQKDFKINGMVPDKIISFKNKLLMGYHFIEKDDDNSQLVQMMGISHDRKNWRDQITIAVDNAHSFCEGSIVCIEDKKLFCYLRDNKSALLRSYICSSLDGYNWSKPQSLQFMGHRIVAAVKKKEPYSGLVVGTFRNTLNKSISIFLHNLVKDKIQIETIDMESNNSLWDFGYTGWIENNDGSLLVVYYIKRHKSNPEICLTKVTLL